LVSNTTGHIIGTGGESCCPGGLHTFLLGYVWFLILIVIYAFAPLSGAHFNPAVSIALLCTFRITMTRAILYVSAQIVGGIAGAGFAYLTIPTSIRGDLAIPQPNAIASVGNAISAEFFATFGLLFGTFATAFDPRGWGSLGPFAIATIVALNAAAVGFISGACMNPARAFGCAVITGKWDYQYVYWIGPVVGGVAGGVLYEVFFMYRENSRVKGVPSTSGDNHRRHFEEKGEKIE